MRREFDQNLAAVLFTVPPDYRPAFHQSIKQFDCAVMPQAEPRRDGRYCRTSSVRQTFDRQ